MRSCLASRRSVSGWGHVTHGARALLPNGFRFRFIPRKVPGLSANPLGFRGGGGAAVQEREAEASPPSFARRRVRGGQSRPAPCQVETCRATSAVVVPGGEFAVASHDRRHARPRLAVLLPPSSPVSPLLFALCAMGPRPGTDLPEAKQLRLCLLSKSGLRIIEKPRRKSKQPL